jgi:hypothetical protein
MLILNIWGEWTTTSLEFVWGDTVHDLGNRVIPYLEPLLARLSRVCMRVLHCTRYYAAYPGNSPRGMASIRSREPRLVESHFETSPDLLE